MPRFIISVIVVLFSFSFVGIAEMQGLQPVSESSAYHQYSRQKSSSELAKILFLLNRFWFAEAEVYSEGIWYDSKKAMLEAKKFISKHYKKQSAEKFVNVYAYRPLKGRDIYQIRLQGGESHPLREVLLDELKTLEEINAK